MCDIPLKNVTSLELFRLGYNLFLAISGPNASLWKLQVNSFQLASNFENVDRFLAIPLDTYRHDSLLLVQNSQSVFVFEPNGFTHMRLIGDLSALCQNCANFAPDVDLSKSHAAVDSVVLQLRTGHAIFLQLQPELQELSDPLERVFRELADLKEHFSVGFHIQLLFLFIFFFL